MNVISTPVVKHSRKSILGDFTADMRVVTLSVLALFVGATSTVVAKALVWLIAEITNIVFFQAWSSTLPSLEGHKLGILIIGAPALGGLIVGLLARYGSEKIRGHGIPEALEAILLGKSKMDLKVAVLKPISSAISIGTGGPFGVEGPIIMTGGALGSLFAQFFHFTAIERRTLLVAGAAAGMCAVFNTPVAAVLLAVELLLFEWKPRSFIPVACAVAMAAALRITVFGSADPLFALTEIPVIRPSLYFVACIVGLFAGLASGVLTALVYGFEDLFLRLRLHWMWWPLLGGFVVGIGGYFEPQALGVGYDVIGQLLRGELPAHHVLVLLLVKMLIWSVALGSGTSGGVLAPLLIIGAALGTMEVDFLPLPDPGLWPLVSMAALMGGTMRSPLTASIFALELTHLSTALPLIFVASVIAHCTTVLLLKRSILTEKVARRGHHIVREYSVDPYDLMRVEEIMEKDVVSVPASMKLSDFSALLATGDKKVALHYAFPILDTEGALVGILTRGDAMRAYDSDPSGQLLVSDAGTADLATAYPDEIVSDVVDRMVLRNVGRMPVVERENPRKILGYVGRSQLIAGRARQIQEEHVRESSWGRSPL